MASKSRSRSTKRNYSRRSSVEGKKFLEQTYNSEYKRTETEAQYGVSQIRKDRPVQPADFNVCPKYLQTATDLEELTTMPAETRRAGDSRRTDSSEKKRHLERTFAEDRLDFIQNYNDLVVKNRMLAREIARLKLHLGLDVEKTPGLETTQRTRPVTEESNGRLTVRPQKAPVIDGPSDFRHFSPVAGGKPQYLTPPDHDEAKRRPGGLHSTINFNLSSSVKKDKSSECCAHESQAKTLATEVQRLENIVAQQEIPANKPSNLPSPTKKVSFAVEAETAEENTVLRARVSSLEAEASELRRQLALSEESQQRTLREAENRESTLKLEIALLSKENASLSEDKVKLLTEVNKLKYEAPVEKTSSQADLARKLAEFETLAQKLQIEADSAASEKHQLHSRLSMKEEEVRKISETARQHQDTIIQLQAELAQLAAANKSPKQRQSGREVLVSGEESPVKEVSSLRQRLEVVSKERDALANEVDELKAAMASFGGPVKLKRHPKSFHQIRAPGTDNKPSGTLPGRRGSVKSEHEEADHPQHPNEPSIGEEILNKSDGAEQSLSARVKEIVEAALNLKRVNGHGRPPVGNFDAEVPEDKSVISRVLLCKERIIGLLKKELKIQREDFKNQIDSLIKEKEELNLELQRVLISQRQQADVGLFTSRLSDLDKHLQDFDKRFMDVSNPEAIALLKRKIIELTTANENAKIEIQSIQCMRKKNEEKIKVLEEEVKRVTEELMASKEALLQVINTLFERNDEQLIEKINNIVQDTHKSTLHY